MVWTSCIAAIELILAFFPGLDELKFVSFLGVVMSVGYCIIAIVMRFVDKCQASASPYVVSVTIARPCTFLFAILLRREAELCGGLPSKTGIVNPTFCMQLCCRPSSAKRQLRRGGQRRGHYLHDIHGHHYSGLCLRIHADRP
jgi:hypothetical protein